jgi:hypothetical protein
VDLIPVYIKSTPNDEEPLQASFTIYLWTILTLVGWLFNAIGPWLL